MDDRPADDEPGDLTRSDLRAIRGLAHRQDWGLPEPVRAKILQRLVDYLDRDHPEGATASDRHVLMAARTLAALMKLGLGQQSIDLAREKHEGKGRGEVPLADAVAEAERLAEERIRERDGPPGDDP